jgi:hypothetical protein
MPVSEDFDEAAAALDAAAQAAAGLVQPARTMMQTVMVGGQLTDVVTDELDAAVTILDQVTTELARLSQTCRERAEISRNALVAAQDYEAAYAAYQTDLRQWQETAAARAPGDRDPGPPPDPPVAPPAPPSWATRRPGAAVRQVWRVDAPSVDPPHLYGGREPRRRSAGQ